MYVNVDHGSVRAAQFFALARVRAPKLKANVPTIVVEDVRGAMVQSCSAGENSPALVQVKGDGIPAGICGVMSGLGISDILARIFRLAKHGDYDRSYELFQGALPQIVFCLQNMELYHHAEKLLLEARGIISGAIVRQATRTLRENEAKHIRFLNSKILSL